MLPLMQLGEHDRDHTVKRACEGDRLGGLGWRDVLTCSSFFSMGLAR